jgi:glycosyltransferase involved in cell wall biosynthesis
MEISVIVTNYNYGRYLSRAIRSLIGQTYDKNEFEILIIDDCSTDGSQDILSAFSANRQVRVIYNDQNLGLAASCNKAIRDARGKYIIRVDADDYVSADFLKVHHLFLSHNKGEMNATSCDYNEVDEKEDIIRRRSGVTFPIACGVMYKLDDIIDLGLYNETLPREDAEFRSRFLQSGRNIYNISIPLYRYTQHSGSMTKGV